MYRIRKNTGAESVYASLEEFSAAVQRGEVRPEDQIFHTRANRWLEVSSHPHYRIATTRSSTSPQSGTQGAVAVASDPAPGRGQTTVRPPLNQPNRAPATPSKSKDLTFLDLGDKKAPKAEPTKPKPPEENKDFLVMSSGLDLPMRTTAGYKIVSENGLVGANLLEPLPVPKDDAPKRPETDAPSEASEPPRAVAPAQPQAPAAKPALRPQQVVRFPAVKLPEAAPKAQAPAVQAAPAPQAPIVQQAPAVVQQVPAAPSAPKAPPTPAPVAAQPAETAEKQDNAQPVEAEKVKDSIQAIEPEQAVGRSAEPETPRAVPEPKPAVDTSSDSASLKAAVSTPIATGGSPAVVDGLTHDTSPPILSAAADPTPSPVEAPAPARGRVVASPPTAAREEGSRAKVLIGAAVGVVVVVGALLVWRPWSASVVSVASAEIPQSSPTPAVGSTEGGNAAPAVNPALLTDPAATGGVTSGTTPTFGGAARVDPDSKAPPVPVNDTPEKIVAPAVRPNFRPEVDLRAATASIAPVASSVNASSDALVSPSELARRFENTQRQVQQELINRLSVIGFNRLLAPNRLGKAESLSGSRAAWNSGADAIRQYRGRIARIADAYEDSLLTSQRGQRWPADEMRAWGTRRQFLEPTELTQVSDLMFTQVNEALELLGGAAGQYQVRDNGIQFRNEGLATRYTTIRAWVAQRIDNWNSLPETTRPVTIAQILKALGDGLPTPR